MFSIFDLCSPRDEVLRSELREDTFAARLKDVIDGNADPIYGDPATFFENTYPTAGLRTLLGDALGRLTGKAAGKNAIIRLETAFGGAVGRSRCAVGLAVPGHQANHQDATRGGHFARPARHDERRSVLLV